MAYVAISANKQFAEPKVTPMAARLHEPAFSYFFASFHCRMAMAANNEIEVLQISGQLLISVTTHMAEQDKDFQTLLG